MQSLPAQPTIVEQAYRAILDAICEGRLEPGERLTQESVAARLSVSRQPVGQALPLLKQQKFLAEAGRRGLSGNRLFVDTMGELWNHLRRAMREVLQHRGYRKAIWDEHAAILHAMAAGDAEGAATRARAHLTNAAVSVQVALPPVAAPAPAAATPYPAARSSAAR